MPPGARGAPTAARARSARTWPLKVALAVLSQKVWFQPFSAVHSQ